MHQANPILLGQYKTEGILREHIQRLGGTIEDGTELRGFEQFADRVDAVLVKASQEEQVSCQYLVGADGARGRTPCAPIKCLLLTFVHQALSVNNSGFYSSGRLASKSS